MIQTVDQVIEQSRAVPIGRSERPQEHRVYVFGIEPATYDHGIVEYHGFFERVIVIEVIIRQQLSSSGKFRLDYGSGIVVRVCVFHGRIVVYYHNRRFGIVFSDALPTLVTQSCVTFGTDATSDNEPQTGIRCDFFIRYIS
jgi:hypothetical protein